MVNACPHMLLEPSLGRALPLMKKQVKVRVSCSKSGLRDFDPYIGCGLCHPLPIEFQGDPR